MRAVVTGGAGFIGSHLVDRLLDEGWQVSIVDSLATGRIANLDSARVRGATIDVVDVTRDLRTLVSDVDWILHLASPASPKYYSDHQVETLEAGSLGTLNALRLAEECDAKFFLASTSEVYGDPTEHPQTEEYNGNVNPTGYRSMYDEAKRFSEAATMAFHRERGLDIRIARIFNTYGPRMQPDDGRALPTFITQAMRREELTVMGDGRQTRSLCYIDDLIEGIWRLINTGYYGAPINLGSSYEIRMNYLASLVASRVAMAIGGTPSPITHLPALADDPERRRPDTKRAFTLLGGWHPKVELVDGVDRTIESWPR